ncbi:uncharacterized protein CMU_027370 [Cryptosporidium muris RN66]|uniref:Gem-associated protein 2 n=1 Tax=Cryptosporidium muris (strain RN66) TaxID=441375 RepID=B6ABH5_CRYMR|nr:uncharacterized protein CMU_027370 [Cryptosporidium muris RN66]EEA05727.1 hypothetical protein, conserved [Cryptosporidium muris RN66]|eukprot:XP_002140076.1 hypothetical protein [Cryptosporidium muris RN66]
MLNEQGLQEESSLYDPEYEDEDVMKYLINVRNEAKLISSNRNSKITESNINDNISDNASLNYFREFEDIMNYTISEQLLDIRNSNNYLQWKYNTIKQFEYIKSYIQELYTINSRDDIIDEEEWRSIYNQNKKSKLSLGKWNSHNWCNLLEIILQDIENIDHFIVNWNILSWIFTCLAAIHEVDSYHSQVTFNMQKIKRYLESITYRLPVDEILAVEAILIIIKNFYNQR